MRYPLSLRKPEYVEIPRDRTIVIHRKILGKIKVGLKWYVTTILLLVFLEVALHHLCPRDEETCLGLDTNCERRTAITLVSGLIAASWMNLRMTRRAQERWIVKYGQHEPHTDSKIC